MNRINLNFNGRIAASFLLSVLGLIAMIGCTNGSAAMTNAVVSASDSGSPDPGISATATPAGIANSQVLPEVSVYDLENGSGYPAEGGYPSEGQEGVLPNPVLIQSSNSEDAGTNPSGNLPTPLPTAVPPTATPPATATPPRLPQTTQNDHYWMKRPIPDGGVVWTDKEYPYGSTRDGQLRVHHGVEFFVGYNVPILAAASGTVIFAGSDSETILGPEPDFYGNVVVIQHDFSYYDQPVYSLYGHLDSVNVVSGQVVEMSQPLGLSGATGIADGAHLHFEVRVGENTYESTRNPVTWLWPFPDNGTLVGRVVSANGQPISQAPVRFFRIDGGDTTVTTALTYEPGEINSDEKWDENFAVDDVDAGVYEVEVRLNGEKYTAEVTVYPRQTAFVEIVIE